MSTTFIGAHSLHRLPRPDFRASQLRIGAQTAQSIARDVESSWASLPPEVRETLKRLVYKIIEPPRGLGPFIEGLIDRVALATLALRGKDDALLDYLRSIRRLVDAVLGAIEREQPAYQQRMREAVQAMTDGQGQPVPEDIGGWLAGVSDQAHRGL